MHKDIDKVEFERDEKELAWKNMQMHLAIICTYV